MTPISLRGLKNEPLQLRRWNLKEWGNHFVTSGKDSQVDGQAYVSNGWQRNHHLVMGLNINLYLRDVYQNMWVERNPFKLTQTSQRRCFFQQWWQGKKEHKQKYRSLSHFSVILKVYRSYTYTHIFPHVCMYSIFVCLSQQFPHPPKSNHFQNFEEIGVDGRTHLSTLASWSLLWTWHCQLQLVRYTIRSRGPGPRALVGLLVDDPQNCP